MDEYITCPKCGNPECREGDSFCFNCGFELGNCCENADCDRGDLPEHWCFCPSCGHASRYYAAALIEQIVYD